LFEHFDFRRGELAKSLQRKSGITIGDNTEVKGALASHALMRLQNEIDGVRQAHGRGCFKVKHSGASHP
jgi:hypothetical protein